MVKKKKFISALLVAVLLSLFLAPFVFAEITEPKESAEQIPAEENTPETVSFYGDIDFDGILTAADARLALRAAVELDKIDPSTLMFFAVDVDYNGELTAADARLILRCAVGLEEADMSEVHFHEWGAWVLTQTPTCAAYGREQRVCLLSETHVQERNTEKSAHVLERIKEKYGGAQEYYLCSVCEKRFYDEKGLEEIPEFPIVTPAPVSGTLQAKCDAILKKYGGVGAQAAVISDGFVTGTYVWGLADKSTGRKVSENTKYRVASLSKLVTDMVFMALVDEGLAREDADISDYFGYKCRNPYYPDTVITPSMLMSHTSSLVVEGARTLEKSILTSSGYLRVKPGTTYSYSNMGICILACICENITGEYFNDLAKKYVFAPLGIDASYLAGELSDTSDLGVLYGEDGGLSVSGMLNMRPKALGKSLNLAMGNLTISAKDYASILAVLLNDGLAMDGTRILSKKSVDAILKQRFDTGKYGLGYGVKIEKTVIEGKTFYVHTGSAYGMFSAFAFCPEEDAGVVVLTSGCGRSSDPKTEIYKVCLEIIRTLY